MGATLNRPRWCPPLVCALISIGCGSSARQGSDAVVVVVDAREEDEGGSARDVSTAAGPKDAAGDDGRQEAGLPADAVDAVIDGKPAPEESEGGSARDASTAEGPKDAAGDDGRQEAGLPADAVESVIDGKPAPSDGARGLADAAGDAVSDGARPPGALVWRVVGGAPIGSDFWPSALWGTGGELYVGWDNIHHRSAAGTWTSGTVAKD